MKELKIGQEVFIVNNSLEIEKKKICAIVVEADETKYKLDISYCGSITRNQLYLKKSRAEVFIKNFKDNLRFTVGDLVIFNYKEWGRKENIIGRVAKIDSSSKPYRILTEDKEYYDVIDSDVIMKIKNEYIENFEDIQELESEYERAKKELNEISGLINKKHEKLEKNLKQSFRKTTRYSLFKKPKFEDRFVYKNQYE